MNLMTPREWTVLGGGAAIGFVALYFWLDYGFWTSLAIEVVLVAASIGIRVRRTSQTAERQIAPDASCDRHEPASTD